MHLLKILQQQQQKYRENDPLKERKETGELAPKSLEIIENKKSCNKIKRQQNKWTQEQKKE